MGHSGANCHSIRSGGYLFGLEVGLQLALLADLPKDVLVKAEIVAQQSQYWRKNRVGRHRILEYTS